MTYHQKKRNRPDKDGADKTIFMRYKQRLLNECGEDGFTTCAICGLPINLSLPYPNPWSLTIDHVVPISKGGRTSFDNMQPAHMKCNRAKSDADGLTIEAINKLRREQGADPLHMVGDLGYITKLSPAERENPEAKADLKRALEGLPQSANWRHF